MSPGRACLGIWQYMPWTAQFFSSNLLILTSVKPDSHPKTSLWTSLAFQNSLQGFYKRQKNVANRILPLQGKSWENEQTECKVNTIIHKLCMWSTSDQPRERLSARGMEGRAHLKSSEYTKELKQICWGCSENAKHAAAGAGSKYTLGFPTSEENWWQWQTVVKEKENKCS